MKRILEVPAIEIRQSESRSIYLFGIDGKEITDFATISRVHRDGDQQVQGYQRPEVLAHVQAIRKYIETPTALIPNALVVAFDNRVSFAPGRGAARNNYSTVGVLRIPIDTSLPDDEKPGWIVDGQQRTAAIREAAVSSFPMSVVGFIAATPEEQRAQFILVNATKPLPKSLIYELLPATEGELPVALKKRQLPSALLERLNYDEDSPLRGMIQTPTTPSGTIKDNSILRALENSIVDGALYRWRDPKTGDGSIDQMLMLLKPFWSAVRAVFPDAWGLPPRRSRLMHGAGVISLSFLMDAIAEPVLDREYPTTGQFVDGLNKVADVCHWTSGEWEFGDGVTRRWNDLQNTSRDVQMLTSFLLYTYRQRTSGV